MCWDIYKYIVGGICGKGEYEGVVGEIGGKYKREVVVGGKG